MTIQKLVREAFSSKVEVAELEDTIVVGPKDKPTFRFVITIGPKNTIKRFRLHTDYGKERLTSNPWDFTAHQTYTAGQAIALIWTTYNIK